MAYPFKKGDKSKSHEEKGQANTRADLNSILILKNRAPIHLSPRALP